MPDTTRSAILKLAKRKAKARIPLTPCQEMVLQRSMWQEESWKRHPKMVEAINDHIKANKPRTPPMPAPKTRFQRMLAFVSSFVRGGQR